MTAQEIFDTLDSAFGNFMVADMNTRRCDTHMCSEEEAMYYARHDGDRTGRIVAHVCGDPAKLTNALYQMTVDIHAHCATDKAVDPVEECEVREDNILVYLCCKYQHDEHRRTVREAFASACLLGMHKVLKGVTA